MPPDAGVADEGVRGRDRNIADLSYTEIAVVHGLRNNHRHQTIVLSDLFRIARLQGCHGRQKAALYVYKTEDIGNIPRLESGMETLLQHFVLFGLGTVPSQDFLDRIEVQMFELALARPSVERLPLGIKLSGQGVKGDTGRLT